jgi:hypothetical protein
MSACRTFLGRNKIFLFAQDVDIDVAVGVSTRGELTEDPVIANGTVSDHIAIFFHEIRIKLETCAQ